MRKSLSRLYRGRYTQTARKALVAAAMGSSAVATIIAFYALLAPLAVVDALGLRVVVKLVGFREVWVFSAPPLESVAVIGKLLLIWASLNVALLGVALYRFRGSVQTLLPAAGVYGLVTGALLSAEYSLMRTVYLDILPKLASAHTIRGGSWVFITEPIHVYSNEITAYIFSRVMLPLTVLVAALNLALLLLASGNAPRSVEAARKVLAIALIALVAAGGLASAASFAMRSVSASITVGERIIWYEPAAPRNATIDLDGQGQRARVNLSVSNRTLLIYDYNSSGGVIAQRTFARGLDFYGDPYLIYNSWNITGYRFINDTGDEGLVLGETYLLVSNQTYSLYVFAFYTSDADPDTIYVGYYHDGTTTVCSAVRAPNYGLSLGTLLYFYGLGSITLLRMTINGVTVCNTILRVDYQNITLVGFDLGRVTLNNTYEMYIDDISLLVYTRSGERVNVSDHFSDGIDDVFAPVHGQYWWLDTYYTGPNGSTPQPPRDGSTGLAIVTSREDTVLLVNTTLPNGTTIQSWLEAPLAECDTGHSAYSVPIRVEEQSGTARAFLWVNVTLNESNFGLWSILDSNASGVYFTLADGSLTLYNASRIDTANKSAVFYVLLPSLPAHSAASLYMHLGGAASTQYRVNYQPPAEPWGVRVIVQAPIETVIIASLLDNTRLNWTTVDVVSRGGTVFVDNSTIINLTVNTSRVPRLGYIDTFAAAPPGSNRTCTLAVVNPYNTSSRPGITLQLYTNMSVVGGLLSDRPLEAELGIVAGRTGTGLDLSSDYIHWVYLNLTHGTYRLRYVDGVTTRETTGAVTVLNGSLMDLYNMTWQERYDLGPLVVFVNPYRATMNWSITIKDTRGNINTYTLARLTQDPNSVLFDVAVAWEDLWWPNTTASLDNYIDHIVRLTLFTNGTMRVELLHASGGYLHMFMLNRTLPPFDTVPAIVDKYMANNHTLDPADSVLYVKAHGDEVTQTTGQVWDPVSAAWRAPPIVYEVSVR